MRKDDVLVMKAVSSSSSKNRSSSSVGAGMFPSSIPQMRDPAEAVVIRARSEQVVEVEVVADAVDEDN